MILNAIVDGRSISIDVPQDILQNGEDFFKKMDSDMDQGWQMSREWIDNPTVTHRCQIAADKMLTAMNNENKTLLTLMAGYILTRLPYIKCVNINTDGDMLETEIVVE